jgi:hypothetical protein
VKWYGADGPSPWPIMVVPCSQGGGVGSLTGESESAKGCVSVCSL